jgi:hypothetical protein
MPGPFVRVGGGVRARWALWETGAGLTHPFGSSPSTPPAAALRINFTLR